MESSLKPWLAVRAYKRLNLYVLAYMAVSYLRQYSQMTCETDFNSSLKSLGELLLFDHAHHVRLLLAFLHYLYEI